MRAPASSPGMRARFSTRLTRPSSRCLSTTISIRSPSRTLPIGPPASASGDTCPMQAPVDTPLNRASVNSATCCRTRGRRGRQLIRFLHPGAERPAADEDEHVARLNAPVLDRGNRVRLGDEDARQAGEAVDAVRRRTDGSMAVLLMTDPSGARFPTGAQTSRSFRARRPPRAPEITSSGSTPSRSSSCWQPGPAGRRFPLVQLFAECEAADGQRIRGSSPARRRCSMTSGTPPA